MLHLDISPPTEFHLFRDKDNSVVIALLIVTLAVGWLNSVLFLGLSDLYDWDFLDYCAQAKRIAEGETYPIRYWPPGYPLLLAMGHWCGVDFETTASFVSLTGNTILALATFLLLQGSKYKIAAIAGLICVLTSHATQLAQRSYLPDTLAAACFLMACASLAPSRKDCSPLALLWSGIAVNLKFVYLLPHFVVLSLLLMVTLSRKHDTTRYKLLNSGQALVLGAVSLLPWALFNITSDKPAFAQINHLNIALGSLTSGIDFRNLSVYESRYPTLESLLRYQWPAITKNWVSTCSIYIAYYIGLGHEHMWNSFRWFESPSIRIVGCFLLITVPSYLKTCWRLTVLVASYLAIVSLSWFSIRFAFTIEAAFVVLGTIALSEKLKLSNASGRQQSAIIIGVITVLGLFDVHRSIKQKTSMWSTRTGTTKYVARELGERIGVRPRIVCNSPWLRFRLRHNEPDWLVLPRSKDELHDLIRNGNHDYIAVDKLTAESSSYLRKVLENEHYSIEGHQTILFKRGQWAVLERIPHATYSR